MVVSIVCSWRDAQRGPLAEVGSPRALRRVRAYARLRGVISWEAEQATLFMVPVCAIVEALACSRMVQHARRGLRCWRELRI